MYVRTCHSIKYCNKASELYTMFLCRDYVFMVLQRCLSNDNVENRLQQGKRKDNTSECKQTEDLPVRGSVGGKQCHAGRINTTVAIRFIINCSFKHRDL